VADFVLSAIWIGVGATALADLWAWMLNRVAGVPSANWGLVGRWFAYFPRGRFVHESIAKAEPVRGEAVVGWTAHYVIGVAYAALLLAIFGMDWAERPTVLPPVILSLVLLVAPFFVMQPGMGAGIAASKTPNPNAARLRSVMTHTVFGLGLYGSAWLASRIQG
jgi:hypothetical protein